MAVTSTPIFPQTIVTPFAQILPATASALVTVYTAGANGSKIERILVSSTDTSARDMQFVVSSGGTDYILSTLAIPLSSGNTNAVPWVSVFESTQFPGLAIDANGNKFIYLASGAVLKAKTLTTVTAARVIAIYTQGADY